MAKKQTLKSLLGGDSREQVDLNLGQVSLANRVQTAGQYGVVVQQTPKTNSALEFAKALSQAPQVMGQLKNIAQKQAQEDVSRLSQQQLVSELAEKDKPTLSIIGYDRAYQHGLVQRHIVMNEAKIAKRFLDQANDPEKLKLDSGEFLNSLEAEREAFVSELMEEFGGNANRENAIKALGGKVTDGLISQTTDAFLKNKEYQAITVLSSNFSDNVRDMGFKDAMGIYRTELQNLGFLSPKEIKEKMHSAIAARNEVHIENADYDTAREEIEEAMKYPLYKGATLGGGAEDKAKLRGLLAKVNKAQEDEDDKFLDNSKGVQREVDLVLSGLADPNADVDQVKGDMKRVLLRAGMQELDAEKYIAQIEEKPDVNGFERLLTEVAREVPNKNTSDLILNQLRGIREQKRLYFSGGAHTIGTFKQADVDILEQEVRAKLDLDPTLRRNQLPIVAGGRSMNPSDPMYTAMMDRVEADYNWARVPSQKDVIIKVAQQAMKKDAYFGDYGSEYSTRITVDLNDVAPDLYRQAKGDLGVYNQLLQDEATQLYGEYQERATARSRVESLLMTETISKAMASKADKTARKTEFRSTMPSFSISAAFNGMNDDQLMADILTDRGVIDTLDIKDDDKTRLKQASLRRWGFPTMASLDLKLLSDSGLGFQDVILGLPVMREMIPALEFYKAKEEGREPEDLTLPNGTEITAKQQEKAAEFWFDYGFDSLQDFLTVETQQTTLRNIRSR